LLLVDLQVWLPSLWLLLLLLQGSYQPALLEGWELLLCLGWL
jgi:hypothetical protein